jgi:hypothetical protein
MAFASLPACQGQQRSLRRIRGGIFTVFRPSLAKISSKAPVNLASRSRTRKRKEPIRVAEVHEQVAGLLGGPRAVRVCGHAEDVHVLVITSMTNSTYRRSRKTVST